MELKCPIPEVQIYGQVVFLIWDPAISFQSTEHRDKLELYLYGKMRRVRFGTKIAPELIFKLQQDVAQAVMQLIEGDYLYLKPFFYKYWCIQKDLPEVG